MDQLLKNVGELYKNLILDREQGMILFVLQRKIEANEIPAHFSYRDIESVIREATANEPGPTPHTERILRVLLHYFIERPPNQRNKFMLTDYALKFVKLIKNKLDSPYKKFPLRKTFDQYAQFKASQINDINDFKGWYERGFHDATKQTILDHLDALKDQVNNSVKELNSILNQDFEKAVEIAEKFTSVFKQVGQKTDEIKDTLRLESVLDHEIQLVVDGYYQKLEAFSHPQNEKEQQEFESLQSDFKEASLIKNQVSEFFLRVDQRLGQLTEKALFASEQLRYLQNNFRSHSRFKVNLKRFLEFTLKEAAFTKEGPVLPSSFPLKQVVKEGFKFIHIPYYDSFISPQNDIVTTYLNKEYELLESQKVEKELARQENTAKWVRKYKAILEEHEEIDFTDHFYEILGEEEDSEIALNVGFEIIQFANDDGNYELGIQKEVPVLHTDNDILTWKVKISKK